MSVSSNRPQIPFQRRSSRMVGAFEPGSDIRDDISVPGSMHGSEHNGQSPVQERFFDSTDEDSSSLLPPQIDQPSSLLNDSAMIDPSDRHEHNIGHTVLEEQEMNRKLTEFESSFLPEPSTISESTDGERSVLLPGETGADETTGMSTIKEESVQEPSETSLLPASNDARSRSTTPRTTEQGYQTPTRQEHDVPNTSALERMSSSPTAARTVSRVQSMASLGGYETAAERDEPDSPLFNRPRSADSEATPRKQPGSSTSSTLRINVTDHDDDVPLNVTRRRPQYLTKRSSNARLSYDSVADSATTEGSDTTLGADYALQSGGAAPDSLRLKRRPQMSLSRSTSLGSLASGISNTSDDEFAPTKSSAAAVAPELSTLQEESPTHRPARMSPGHAVVTPRASSHNIVMPTDSVIANHVRDISVPDTIARQYRSERSKSPDKVFSNATMTPGPKRGLTLKEHRSTVEKLGKENFDLKMKIHFLDQALQKRSDDGIKEMITENVALKTKQLQIEKENFTLRKQVRELQRKLDDANGSGKDGEDQGYATDDERSPTVEEEVVYLRERMETTEIEIEKLRAENLAKETEKRRLAEMVRNIGESRAGTSEVGSREERDMWKDMLEAETIAREQAEEDAKKLRDELSKLRQESMGSASRSSSKLRVVGGKIVSRSSSVEGSKMGRADTAELERLRHETSELQKTIGAQASALTSRNKEKEMLYQEIENLKLGRMSGLRSVAGDSILDRSASRARSNSRASNGTRFTKVSDTERESLETRIDQLRDEVSQLKLDRQNLQNQFEDALAELEAVDAQAQADADQFNEELGTLAQERDIALRDAEEQDHAFQQLKNEAQEEIDGLGDELDAKIEECERLQRDLKTQGDGMTALQAEMRSASEGLVRLEENAQQNLARYQTVKAELDDANRELENYETSLRESESKVERLTVQQESSRNEIAFLREEQDGDKIKIGDLESLLKKTHLNLDVERDRAKELERRLSDERVQRDAVANQEKQEVQRMLNDLNRETSASKDELRRVRKALSQREVEVTSYRDRLAQLEESLRQIINDPSAAGTQIVGAVSRMNRDLEQANADLDNVRSRLDEHKKLLADRDVVLENSSLENKRLAELIERERQNHRQDTHSFEQALRSHQQASRMVNANNARIAELETARQSHRKQISTLELSYKDQLAERNQVLLTIWRKLSAMCGPDWAHNHSLINGNLPSQEVIGNMLFWPGFSRNLLLAAKQVEGVLTGFKEKVKNIERELWRNYKALEKEFDARNKKLERIEEAWEKIKLREREVEAGLTDRNTLVGVRTDAQRFKGENKLLKAELQLLREQVARHALQSNQAAHNLSHQRTSSVQRAASRSSQFTGNSQEMEANSGGGIPSRASSIRRPGTAMNQAATLIRHQSASAIESLSVANNANLNIDGSMSRSNSRSSGQGFTISGPQAPPAAGVSSSDSREDIRRSLIVPSLPYNAPSNGNFSIPPHSSSTEIVATSQQNDLISPIDKMKADESKWIHRMRELERRLKHEREQRLVDRSGMRKRLEERDATNEELRKELERERMRNDDESRPSMDGEAHHRPQTQTHGQGGGQDWRGDYRVRPAYEEDIGTPVRTTFANGNENDYGFDASDERLAEGRGVDGLVDRSNVHANGVNISPSKTGSIRSVNVGMGLGGARGGVS